MKKGRQALLYVLSSLTSFVLDAGLFYLFKLLLGVSLGIHTEAVCNVSARAISSFYNFNVNNRLVFRNDGSYGKALLRYYCLCIPQLAVSTLLISLLVHLFGLQDPSKATLVKVVVDGGLFVASFFIQKFWVFSHKEDVKNDYESKGTENDVRN